jgi:hypothetical protein
MVDPIWQPSVVVAEFKTWLGSVLPAAVGGKALTMWQDTPPPETLLPFVVCSALPGSTPVASAAVSDYHDILYLQLGIQALCGTETETRALFDIIRAKVAARTRTGYVTPMALTTARVMTRTANYDGAPDLVGGLWQQFETFEITYQRP